MVRRAVLVLAVAVLGAGAGSALLASPALAGGVDNNGVLSAGVYNGTPYTMTLVDAQTPQVYPVCAPRSPDCWNTRPAPTIAPGSSAVYRIQAYSTQGAFGRVGEASFDAWFTYRVDVLGGPPEYMTVAYLGGWTAAGDSPSITVYDTTAPPPSNWDQATSYGPNAPPVPGSANPQISYEHNAPYLYDQTFLLAGDHTVDARSNQGQVLAGVLDALCVKAASTSCSFTQTGPLTWGVGSPTIAGQARNCTITTAAQPKPSTRAVGDEPPRIPDPAEPDWLEVAYSVKQSATLSVGGSVSASTELDLFEVVGTEVTVELEAEHEWTETKEFERSSKVFIPSNDIAHIYVAPTVGNVTGTLTLTSGAGTLTVTNFTEERSGVTRDVLTPAFNDIVRIRPMTAAEKADCPPTSSATKGLGAPTLSPALTKVKAGQTRAQVLRELGTPAWQRFRNSTCRAGNLRCEAAGGRGGTWVYSGVLVAFGATGRVSAIIRIDGGRLRSVTA